MFEPDLFGLWTTSQMLSLASTLVVPALGFVFLYLANLPLSKWPADLPTDARAPKIVLKVFAQVSIFFLTFLVATASILSFSRERNMEEEWLTGFHVIRTFPKSKSIISSLKISISKYDGASNLAIYINGYRIFGTHVDCLVLTQCRDDQQIKDVIDEKFHYNLKLNDNYTIYPLSQKLDLPKAFDLMPYMTGTNDFIDIVSTVSGVGGCDSILTLDSLRSDGTRFSSKIHISLDNRTTQKNRATLSDYEPLGGGGTWIPGAETEIEPYKTKVGSHLFRVCSRLRIALEGNNQPIILQGWKEILLESRRRAICTFQEGRSANLSTYCQQ